MPGAHISKTTHKGKYLPLRVPARPAAVRQARRERVQRPRRQQSIVLPYSHVGQRQMLGFRSARATRTMTHQEGRYLLLSPPHCTTNVLRTRIFRTPKRYGIELSA